MSLLLIIKFTIKIFNQMQKLPDYRYTKAISNSFSNVLQTRMGRVGYVSPSTTAKKIKLYITWKS